MVHNVNSVRNPQNLSCKGVMWGGAKRSTVRKSFELVIKTS